MGAQETSVARPSTGTVAVIAGDELLTAGLVSLLAQRGVAAQPVASFAALREAEVVPGVVVWVCEHAEPGDLEALWDVRELHDLAVCVIARTLDVKALRAVLRRGSDRVAVLSWRAELDFGEVHRALRQLVRGSAVLSPGALEQLIADSLADKERLLDRLTEQETSVLELMAAGLRNGAIARKLGRSEKLVEKHVGRIFAKLELDQQADPDVDRRVRASRIFLLGDPARGGSLNGSRSS